MGLPGFGVTEFIEVALRVDESLDMTAEEFDKYVQSGGDNALLKIKPGMAPVLFKMRKKLPYNLYLKLEDIKMELVKKKDGDKVTNEMQPKIAWICEDVRFSIVDIINPPSTPEGELVEFKRDSEGSCSEEIMSYLMSVGAQNDLWAAKNASLKKEKVIKKK